METGVKCPLCGLDSETLPHRARDEMGVSCKRCGDFYIDGMLICKGPPADTEARAIMSGHTKWAKILGKPPVDITVNNFNEIIISHTRLSHLDKVDLLLIFYSIKEPRPGHYINFDERLEIPIIYSADDKEFTYLISDLARQKLGYLDYVARGTIRITPHGWERIDRLQRVQLANEKIELISVKIDKDTNFRIANAKEKVGVIGNRYSSTMARQIRDILLESIKLKLEKKLEIDKEVIIGAEVVSYLDNINFLSERIRSFWEEKKESVLNNLKDQYEDCHGMTYYESAKDEFLKEVGREVRLLQIDLKTGETRTDKELAEGKKLTDRIETPDPKRILVVYGRNEKARKAIFELLRAVDLKPFEWGEAVKKTGKASPYVGEILDEAFKESQAVIVLLTGDDIAHLREEYIKPNDTEHEGRPSLQARTNVVFEAGRAFGTHPDRTVLVELDKERTKAFSDIGGRYVLRMSNQPEKRKELVDRLKMAGCDVCIDDRTDWMSAGDFDGAALGWLSGTPEQPNQIRGERQARKPGFDKELGTANLTGFSKKQVWTAAMTVLKAEKIEVAKTSESWIFARQTTGDKVEVDIGIVDHPERDDLRPWAPAVSIGIDVPILGELGDNRTWTPEQRRTLSHEIYEKITDVLYSGPAK
ncbi:MAG: nucleotide-binding protein [Candidatus Aminicenantes bacterium]|nr:nucleotide-binding protein [Candidatus Aminicenantes bacterium]